MAKLIDFDKFADEAIDKYCEANDLVKIKEGDWRIAIDCKDRPVEENQTPYCQLGCARMDAERKKNNGKK